DIYSCRTHYARKRFGQLWMHIYVGAAQLLGHAAKLTQQSNLAVRSHGFDTGAQRRLESGDVRYVGWIAGAAHQQADQVGEALAQLGDRVDQHVLTLVRSQPANRYQYRMAAGNLALELRGQGAAGARAQAAHVHPVRTYGDLGRAHAITIQHAGHRGRHRHEAVGAAPELAQIDPNQRRQPAPAILE